MRCHLCSDGLEHCHEASIVHTDVFAECGGDGPCSLPHHLHEWRVTCAEFDPPCPCGVDQPVEQRPPERLARHRRTALPLAA